MILRDVGRRIEQVIRATEEIRGLKVDMSPNCHELLDRYRSARTEVSSCISAIRATQNLRSFCEDNGDEQFLDKFHGRAMARLKLAEGELDREVSP